MLVTVNIVAFLSGIGALIATAFGAGIAWQKMKDVHNELENGHKEIHQSQEDIAEEIENLAREMDVNSKVASKVNTQNCEVCKLGE